MFQVNAKTDHGLLIMLELANNYGSIQSLSSLALSLKVSSSYLSQIAKSLQLAGLIKSKEGVGGGYFLSRRPSSISILEVLESLSGEIKIRCSHTKNKNCPHLKSCQLKSMWPVVLSDIKKSLAKRSLASLLK